MEAPLTKNQGEVHFCPMTGIAVSMRWKFATSPSEVKLNLSTMDGDLLKALDGPLREVVQRPAERQVSGNLPELTPLCHKLRDGDKSALKAILCYTRGSKCGTCSRCEALKSNLFDGCVRFGGLAHTACATCILEGCASSCSLGYPVGPDSDDESEIDTEDEEDAGFSLSQRSVGLNFLNWDSK
jgi:hypothetical protein